MTQKHTFTAIIQNPGGGGAFVEIPFDVEKAFGSKVPKVNAMIEEAKKDETRMARIVKTIGMLKQGRRGV